MTQFKEIPNTIRVPFVFVEINSDKAQGTGIQKKYKGLIVGHKLSTGTANADQLYLVSSDSKAVELFGEGSMLVQQYRAFAKENKLDEVYLCAVADPSAGAKAYATVALTGPATDSGTLKIYVAGYCYSVAVAKDDTASAVASAVVDKYEDDTSSPFTVTANSGTLKFESKYKGILFNELDIRVNYYNTDKLPEGLAAVVTAFAHGTDVPTLTGFISAMGDIQFDTIAMPFTDDASLDDLEDELEDRLGAIRSIEGMAYICKELNYSDLTSFGQARNSRTITTIPRYGELVAPWVVSAGTAAIALREFGTDPARGVNGVEVKACIGNAIADNLTFAERNNLLFNGISDAYADDYGVVRLSRLISMYKTNSGGAPDTAWLDNTTLFTVGKLRYDIRTLFRTKYPRHKLADDGAGYEGAVITPSIAKAEIIGLYNTWIKAGLVESGQAYEDFKTALSVTRDETDRTRLNISLDPDLMNQANGFAFLLSYLL